MAHPVSIPAIAAIKSSAFMETPRSEVFQAIPASQASCNLLFDLSFDYPIQATERYAEARNFRSHPLRPLPERRNRPHARNTTITARQDRKTSVPLSTEPETSPICTQPRAPNLFMPTGLLTPGNDSQEHTSQRPQEDAIGGLSHGTADKKKALALLHKGLILFSIPWWVLRDSNSRPTD